MSIENLSTERLIAIFRKTVLPHWPGYEEKGQFITGMKGSGPNNFGYKMDPFGIQSSFRQHKYNKQQLVHFTSLQKCKAILCSRTLRMYDLHYMKDPSEFSWLAKSLALSQYRIDNSKSKIFISSMCDPDILNGIESLRHWEKYADEGQGCAIIFEFDRLNQGNSDVAALRIDYDEHNFTQFKEAFQLLENTSKKRFEVDEFLLIIAGLYKNGSKYQWEDEVRLVHIYDQGCSLNWELHHSGKRIEDLAPYCPETINNPQTSFYYQKNLDNKAKPGRLPMRISKVFTGPKFEGDIDSMRSRFDPIEFVEWSSFQN